ncbi:hypothetical protein [Brevibacillus laterosporus]
MMKLERLNPNIAYVNKRPNPKIRAFLAVYSTTINARNTENDKAATVTKRDNGALPDAVLDIWKTGVEDFGLKWDKNLSFKGRYYYEF